MHSDIEDDSNVIPSRKDGRLIKTDLQGALVGMCWGGYQGELNVHLDISRDRGREPGSLKKLIEAFTSELGAGGDFVEAKLSPKSFITVTLIKVRRDRVTRVERSFDITKFKTISDYVAKEH